MRVSDAWCLFLSPLLSLKDKQQITEDKQSTPSFPLFSSLMFPAHWISSLLVAFLLFKVKSWHPVLHPRVFLSVHHWLVWSAETEAQEGFISSQWTPFPASSIGQFSLIDLPCLWWISSVVGSDSVPAASHSSLTLTSEACGASDESHSLKTLYVFLTQSIHSTLFNPHGTESCCCCCCSPPLHPSSSLVS